MAIALLGPIVSDIRGSVGGTTFSRSLAGATVRSRRGPVASASTSRGIATNRIAGLSKAFQRLSASQQLQWAAFASANPIPNRYGTPRNISPIAMYSYLNGVLSALSYGVNGAPPASLDVVPLESLQLSARAQATGLVTVRGNISGPLSDYVLDLRFSSLHGNAARTPRNGYKLLFKGTYPLNVAVNVTSLYVNKFGPLTAMQGTTIMVKGRVVNRVSGAHSPWLRTYTVVGGAILPDTGVMQLNSVNQSVGAVDKFLNPIDNFSNNGNSPYVGNALDSIIAVRNWTVKNLFVQLDQVDPVVGYTYTLAINGIDTALAVSVDPTMLEASDTVTTVDVDQGDRISWHRTTSAGATTALYIGVNVDLEPR